MLSPSIETITSNTTLDPNSNLFLIDASSNSITITLPNIFSDGIELSIRRLDTNVYNNVTVIGSNGQTINSRNSIIINPNITLTLTSYNNQWHITNDNNKNNEIHIVFSSTAVLGLSRLSYATINNSSFVSLGSFVYKGSNYYMSNPIKFEAVFSLNSDLTSNTNFTIQLFDITNSKIFSTIGPIASTGNSITINTVNTNTFINIPSNKSIIEVSVRINSGTSIRVHSINLTLN